MSNVFTAPVRSNQNLCGKVGGLRVAHDLEGFSLVELLIVVAIIAILAAIAVPNFLEAQVRARVARVKADQRNLVTALEAYRVDTNRLPDPRRQPIDNFNMIRRLNPLTTPIAYLSSVPPEVFPATFVLGTGPIYLPQRIGGNAYVYGRGDRAGEFGTVDLGSQYLMVASAGPDGFLQQIHYYPAIAGMSGSHQCPVCDVDLLDEIVSVPYDPTNGTVSAGDIYRWSSGGG
jgi:prepilin-type N-terminal cleavage/methylation domain-containing protein